MITMGYWAQPAVETAPIIYPIPGSLTKDRKNFSNQDRQDKLEYLNIIVYTFLHVAENGDIIFQNNQTAPSAQESQRLKAFVKLQNKKRILRKIISIGGANSGDSFNHAISHIAEFTDAVSRLLQTYTFDGIDLDFEPNTFTAEQSVEYSKLLTALREKLGPHVLITLAIAPDQNITRKSWKILADKADYISDMCYEFHGPDYFPHLTGYSSNLYTDANEPMMNHYFHISCDQSLKSLTFLGVPTQKILLGYPSYALTYGGVNNKNQGLFQAFDPALTPDFDKEIKTPGSASYKTVILLLKKGFHVYSTLENNHLSATWAYNPATKQFLAFDTAELVKEKMRYACRYHLGGLMTWNINDDTSVANKDSLLKAAQPLC